MLYVGSWGGGRTDYFIDLECQYFYLNFIALFPITKYFILGIKNLEDRHKRFEECETGSIIPPPRAICEHVAIAC